MHIKYVCIQNIFNLRAFAYSELGAGDVLISLDNWGSATDYTNSQNSLHLTKYYMICGSTVVINNSL